MKTKIDNLDMDFRLRAVNSIYNDCGLNVICGYETITKRNIAHTIQLLDFFDSMLSHNSFPRELEASFCRNIVIQSYSVLDALIISAAYEIQNCCRYCPRRYRCDKCCTSLFVGGRAKDNEKDAFINADKFLKESGLLIMKPYERKLYDEFRKKRNSIHLTQWNSNCIPDDPSFTKEYCYRVMNLIGQIIDVLEVSVPKYKEEFGCPEAHGCCR